MPREGIDYDGGWISRLGCGVKCSINKLYSLVSGKIGFLNTVGPDTSGKVEIVSDTSNIIVTDDPSDHQIHLDLDPGLSSPPVTSVAGKTGAVTLDGDDVAYDANDTVNDKIDDVASDVSTLSGTVSGNYTALNNAINGEIANRQAQDAAIDAGALHKTGAETKSGTLTLQDNPVVSNASTPGLILQDTSQVQGTLPSSNVFGVIRYADAAMSNMGGMSFYRNTAGGTQVYLSAIRNDAGGAESQVGIVDDGTQAFGFAPTPGSTAHSGAITTIGYVSASGSGRANNLIHDNGIETLSGQKTFLQAPIIYRPNDFANLIFQSTRLAGQNTGGITWYYGSSLAFAAQILVGVNSSGTGYIKALVRNSDGTQKTVTLAEGDVI